MAPSRATTEPDHHLARRRSRLWYVVATGNRIGYGGCRRHHDQSNEEKADWDDGGPIPESFPQQLVPHAALTGIGNSPAISRPDTGNCLSISVTKNWWQHRQRFGKHKRQNADKIRCKHGRRRTGMSPFH